jgi:hypothetical protein
MKRCPGSLAFTQPKPEYVECPDCGGDVELWSDEATGRCAACGATVIRNATQSCVDWCRYAQECLGADKYRSYRRMKAALRKPALLVAYGRMTKGTAAVREAERAAACAEQLLSREPDAEPNVVIAAAVFSAAPEKPAPEAVAAVLAELEYQPDAASAVLALAAAPVSEFPDSVNGAVCHDALLLAKALGRRRRVPLTDEEFTAFVDRLRSVSGRGLAEEMRAFLRPDG